MPSWDVTGMFGNIRGFLKVGDPLFTNVHHFGNHAKMGTHELVGEMGTVNGLDDGS
jgi:hypothetical protein